MNEELAKKLQDAGFYFREQLDDPKRFPIHVYHMPTLSELIEACGLGVYLERQEVGYKASKWGMQKSFIHATGWYENPEEAVANLYLALHTKTEI